MDPRTIWDDRYAEMRQRDVHPKPDLWLEKWSNLLSACPSFVLDLGCGSCLDARSLIELGIPVIATDFSREALKTARQNAIGSRFVRADLSTGLPFLSVSCHLILANLVLHYFTWDNTITIVDDIRRCVGPGGWLLARLNSIHDVNFGAQGNPKVESNLYMVKGHLKRFFDRESAERLFSNGWSVEELEERKTSRYLREKCLWEVLVKKV